MNGKGAILNEINQKGNYVSAAIVLALLLGGNVHASTTNSKEYTPKKLIIASDPSSNAETMESKAQPFGKLVSKQLGIRSRSWLQLMTTR